nr:unnamed protein product [Callosobruchus analis]
MALSLDSTKKNNIDALNENDSVFNSITFQNLNEKEHLGTKRKREQLISKLGNKKKLTNSIKQNTSHLKEGMQGKKVKVAATPSKTNEQDELVLENTLDDINITMIEEKKAEYDAFADFLKTPLINANCASDRKNESDKDNTNMLSQFFNTQMIKQVDSAIDLGSSESIDDDRICKSIEVFINKSVIVKKSIESTPCAGKSNVAEIKPTQKNETVRDPLFLSFKERLKSKDWNNKIEERSLLFEDEKATTTYRNEVDNLFEQIEHSIFAMGDENTESGEKLQTIYLSIYLRNLFGYLICN